jgi:hypothetical protein
MKLKEVNEGVVTHCKRFDEQTELRIVINAYNKRVWMSYIIRGPELCEGYCPGLGDEPAVVEGPLLHECMRPGELCDGDLEVER